MPVLRQAVPVVEEADGPPGRAHEAHQPASPRPRRQEGARRGHRHQPRIDQTSKKVEACHQDTHEPPECEPFRFCGKTFRSWAKLTVHLLKHMEHISLSVLGLVAETEHVSTPLYSFLMNGRVGRFSFRSAISLAGCLLSLAFCSTYIYVQLAHGLGPASTACRHYLWLTTVCLVNMAACRWTASAYSRKPYFPDPFSDRFVYPIR